MYEWIFVSLPFLVVILMYYCIRMMNSSCQNNERARKGPEALSQSEEIRIINSAFIQQGNSKEDRNKPISRWRFLTFLFLTYIGSLLWKASIICNNSDSFTRSVKGFAEWLKASFPAFAIILIILSIYLFILIWRWLREIGIDEHWAFAVITIPYALNIISNWLYSAGDMFGWIAYALSGNGAILIVCLALAALPTRDTKIKLSRRFVSIKQKPLLKCGR